MEKEEDNGDTEDGGMLKPAREKKEGVALLFPF